jgi:F0F1-type ATP synthase membrane subunit b/b'
VELNPPAVAVVIALVLLCAFVLNTLVFQPILRVTEARATAVRDARELAESAAQKAAQASAEFDHTLGNARTDVYQQMDQARQQALDARTAVLADARKQAEAAIADATGRVRAQAQEARQSLDREADQLAGAIVERVLGRSA